MGYSRIDMARRWKRFLCTPLHGCRSRPSIGKKKSSIDPRCRHPRTNTTKFSLWSPLKMAIVQRPSTNEDHLPSEWLTGLALRRPVAEALAAAAGEGGGGASDSASRNDCSAGSNSLAAPPRWWWWPPAAWWCSRPAGACIAGPCVATGRTRRKRISIDQTTIKL